MGPESAKSYRGQAVVRLPDDAHPAGRAKQEADYGRRGKGYVFGAFTPAGGQALTETYSRRTIANYVDFLEKVDLWLPETNHVYSIVDNLSTHRATDVLLFTLAHPRWEFVFQPKYAAYLNLIGAVVEGAALAGTEGQTLRDLGRGTPCGGEGHRILEQASSSLHVGQAQATPSAP